MRKFSFETRFVNFNPKGRAYTHNNPWMCL